MSGRIGKVTMKETGFSFRVIDGPADPDNDMGATMMRHARAISAWPGLTGSLVVGVFEDGTTSTAFRWDDKNCSIPRALLPSWIAEVVRRDMITGQEAESVCDNKFEWVE